MWKRIVECVQNFLAPEDARIQKILDMPAGAMLELLPKSAVYSSNISVLFDYQNKIVRTIVKLIKYKDNAGLRKKIAGLLYEEITELSSDMALFDGSPPILVPMPMSKMEKRKKGFNQCEELCREIKKLGRENIEVSYNTLKKVRETERQTTLGREERAENVKDSMMASSPQGNHTAIVLDDVYTTGASLLEARRALLSAGFRRVYGLFIAH